LSPLISKKVEFSRQLVGIFLLVLKMLSIVRSFAAIYRSWESFRSMKICYTDINW
jgi:hypothetical protein